MATQPEDLEIEQDGLDVGTEAGETAPPEDDESGADEQDGEAYVSFGGDDDEPAEAAETDLVKHLRRQVRELHKRVAASPQQHEPEIVVGDRPRLADYDYDTEAFDRALDAYDERREAKRKQDAQREAAAQKQNEQWQQVVTRYAERKRALPFADKDVAEAAAFEELNDQQQAIIARVAPDPALFIYAAGKNRTRLNELAAISDPLELAAAVGRIGANLTMKKRSKAPPPEEVVRGGIVRQGADKELARLEKEADRTGDRTALVKYKRAKRGAVA